MKWLRTLSDIDNEVFHRCLKVSNAFLFSEACINKLLNPLNHLGRLLNALRTFNLSPVSNLKYLTRYLMNILSWLLLQLQKNSKIVHRLVLFPFSCLSL